MLTVASLSRSIRNNANVLLLGNCSDTKLKLTYITRNAHTKQTNYTQHIYKYIYIYI